MTLFAAIADRIANFGPFLDENWPVLLPVALGFVGVYWLLPRARASKPILGALCAALAVLLGGWYAVDIEGALPEKILFYIFAGIAVTGGILLIAQKNPVHAALSFALVVLSTCGLFLLQAAPFLMAATIIIYAGAIVVTFLFVIMLAQQAGVADADQRSREPFLASLAGFLLIGSLFCVLHKNYNTAELDGLLEQLRQLAEVKTADDVIAIMGDPSKRPREQLTHPLVDNLGQYFPGEPVANLETAWQQIRQPQNVLNLRAYATRLLTVAPRRRLTQGSLTPAEGLPLSKLSGPPPNTELTPTPLGRLPERLPSQNVAGIGVSLFTDYLVPVELAAMLLLVATIGAIAIAGRRTEGLR